MLRLGLQLTLHSGREALVRLLVTAAAVAVGVALLLGVLAEFHAFQANANQPCWSCTTGSSVPSHAARPAASCGTTAWTSTRGRRSRGSTSPRSAPARRCRPASPGCPLPGEYYASPALAALLRTVPADRARRPVPWPRWPARSASRALTGANDLVIYIGYTPAAARARSPARPGSPRSRTAPRGRGVHPVLPVCVPCRRARGAVPDARADRHRHPAGGRPPRGAVRRAAPGRRDAAPTSGSIASVEAVVSAFLGAVLGTVIFLLVQPAARGGGADRHAVLRVRR